MKRRRIVFLKKQKGVSVAGMTALQFIREGSRIAEDRGGGRVSEITYADGMVTIRKITADGKPCRDYGTIKMGDAGGVQRDVKLEADGVIFPAHLCEQLLFVDEDEPEDIEQPAKPIKR